MCRWSWQGLAGMETAGRGVVCSHTDMHVQADTQEHKQSTHTGMNTGPNRHKHRFTHMHKDRQRNKCSQTCGDK